MDDIWKQILILLPPKSLRNIFISSNYFYTLPDQLFWKDKVNRDYHCLTGFLQSKNHKDRYYLFSSDIKVSILFEHTYDDDSILHTETNLKNVLVNNIELSLLIAIHGNEELETESFSSRFYGLKNIEDHHVEKYIVHSFTCILCYFEDLLVVGLKLFNKWKDIYDISIFEISCIILSIKPLHEERYRERYSMPSVTLIIDDYEKYPFIKMSIDEQMKYWMELTNEQRDKIRNDLNDLIKSYYKQLYYNIILI